MVIFPVKNLGFTVLGRLRDFCSLFPSLAHVGESPEFALAAAVVRYAIVFIDSVLLALTPQINGHFYIAALDPGHRFSCLRFCIHTQLRTDFSGCVSPEVLGICWENRFSTINVHKTVEK